MRESAIINSKGAVHRDIAPWEYNMKKIGVLCFLLLSLTFSALAEVQEYPRINISGYKKWLYSKVEIQPLANYWLALDNELIEPSSSGGPWVENLKLNISAELSKDLRVVYDLEQLPDLLDKYTVGIGYQDYWLGLGQQNDIFTNQEYIAYDFINGIGGTARFNNLKLSVISGKYPTQSFVTTSSNESWKVFRNSDYGGSLSPTYSIDNPDLEFLSFDLGGVNFDEESVGLEINNRRLIKNTDYFVDEVYGLVLIRSSLKGEVKISYSRSGGERVEKKFDLKKDTNRRAFLSPELRIVDNSEIVTVDDVTMARDIDYHINYNLGLVVMKEPLHNDAKVRIDYNYSFGANHYSSETISGQTGTSFTLQHKYIISKTEIVTKNNSQLLSGYLMNYTNGTISFSVPLVATDTVTVSYNYLGIRQDIAGANVEYKLNDWCKFGSSLVSITPAKADEALFNQMSPSSYLVGNFYNTTKINENTLLNTEIALSNSNQDYRNSNTIEADSSLKLYGRTRLWNADIDVTYRKQGLNFASESKVKNSVGNQSDSLAERLKYSVNDKLSVTGAQEIMQSRFAYNLSGTTATTLLLGLNYQPFDLWRLEAESRYNHSESDLLPHTVNSANYLYSNLQLTNFWPLAGSCSYSDLVYKWIGTSQGDGMYETSSATQAEIGWLAKFNFGLTTYLRYSQDKSDNHLTGSSEASTTPFYRLTYTWNIWGANLELGYDYAQASQTGAINASRNEQTTSMVLTVPTENPVVSEFQFSGSLKTTDYSDLDNSINNYRSSLMNVQGSLVF